MSSSRRPVGSSARPRSDSVMSEQWFDARSDCSDDEAPAQPKKAVTKVVPLFSKENVPPFGIYGRTKEFKAFRQPEKGTPFRGSQGSSMGSMPRMTFGSTTPFAVPRPSYGPAPGFGSKFGSMLRFPDVFRSSGAPPLGAAEDEHLSPWPRMSQTLLPQAYGSERLSIVDMSGALGAPPMPPVRKSGQGPQTTTKPVQSEKIQIIQNVSAQDVVLVKKKKKKSKRAKADAGADGDKKRESQSDDTGDGEEDNTKTTVMVRNLPNRYPIPKLIEVLRANGAGPFNYFYAPMDLRYKHNVGYCFLNFFDPKDAAEFKVKFRGFTLPETQSKKVMDVDYAMTQGFQANVDETCARLKVSSVGVPKACQPIFFDIEGNEISPPNTQPEEASDKDEGAKIVEA